MTIFTVADIDIVYLSYDEPNCESNWADLQSICPRAQRVHGVKGSDAAHKACAEITTGSHMITIDGDNQIRPEFLTQSWSFDSSWDLSTSVLSFPSENAVNGLRYGNGGIKIWPRAVVETMQTHEAVATTEHGASVDFCWVLDYVLMPGVWSQALINHTPHQAWRAGFREGVKLSLVDGQRIQDPQKWRSSMVKNNMDRLLTWLQVGLDQPNGAWAILGARQGLHRCLLTGWDHTQVQDFDLLDAIWEREIDSLNAITGYTQDLGVELRNRLNLAVEPDAFSPAQSTWFKSVFAHPNRAEPRRLRA
jgi:hypothetical protein